MSPRRPSSLVSPLIAAVSLVAFVALVVIGRTGGPKPGEKLDAAAVLTHPDGREISLPEATGAPSLIHYWATWCEPCMEEMPAVMDLGRAAKERGAKTYALSVRDDPEKVADTPLAASDVYLLVNDPGGRATTAHHVAGVPETLLLDRDGRLVLRIQGPIDARRQAEILAALSTL